MSKTLNLKAEIDALCKKAGLDPSFVESIEVTYEMVVFTVWADPKTVGLGGPEKTYVTFPYSYQEED